MGHFVKVSLHSLYPLEKEPVPIIQEAGCAAGPDWTGAENFFCTGTQSVDRRVRSRSLY